MGTIWKGIKIGIGFLAIGGIVLYFFGNQMPNVEKLVKNIIPSVDNSAGKILTINDFTGMERQELAEKKAEAMDADRKIFRIRKDAKAVEMAAEEIQKQVDFTDIEINVGLAALEDPEYANNDYVVILAHKYNRDKVIDDVNEKTNKNRNRRADLQAKLDHAKNLMQTAASIEADQKVFLAEIEKREGALEAKRQKAEAMLAAVKAKQELDKLRKSVSFSSFDNTTSESQLDRIIKEAQDFLEEEAYVSNKANATAPVIAYVAEPSKMANIRGYVQERSPKNTEESGIKYVDPAKLPETEAQVAPSTSAEAETNIEEPVEAPDAEADPVVEEPTEEATKG